MFNFKNLIAIDLASYGIAFAIINQFCDDENVKVFEVSPVANAGLLILLVQDSTTADFLKNEISSFYKANILSIEVIKDFDPHIIATYLSQNKPNLAKNLVIQEFRFVSVALQEAQQLCLKKIELVDFRTIRTQPLNAILIATAHEMSILKSPEKSSSAQAVTFIENAEKIVRDYFEILHN